jgi:mycothiol system anti-sigma-R factor
VSGDVHDTPCGDVIQRAFEYLDGELADLDCSKIAQHLEECASCLDEYHRNEQLKALVRRSCGCESAPEQLRSKIVAMARITTTTVRIDYDR